MKRVFADTHFFIALLNARDAAHLRAAQIGAGTPLRLITTRWVLAEVADAMSGQLYRARAVSFFERIDRSAWLTVLDDSDLLYSGGCQLWRQRPDKLWSLTDCISFAAMNRHGLTEALTGDHHFEQAGFVALLK